MQCRVGICTLLTLAACAHGAEDREAAGRLPDYAPVGMREPEVAHAEESAVDPRVVAEAEAIRSELAFTAYRPEPTRAPSRAPAPKPTPAPAGDPPEVLPEPEPATLTATVAAPAEYATLDVRVSGRADAECSVSIDGRSVGSTPLVALEVPLGESPVRVVCGRRERFSDLLRFQPGDQLKLVVMVAEQEPTTKRRKARRKRRRGKRRR